MNGIRSWPHIFACKNKMLMAIKLNYESPRTRVFAVSTEGIICGSPIEQSLHFGDEGASGFLDDDNYFDGGLFG